MIYVDDACCWSLLTRVLRRPAHLYADTLEELDRMGLLLGLSWGQVRRMGTEHEHYPVTHAQRVRALALGAVSISYPNQTAALVGDRRDGVMPP